MIHDILRCSIQGRVCIVLYLTSSIMVILQLNQICNYIVYIVHLLFSLSSHTDPNLPSLGASLGSEFDAFGADNLNLTKLLGSDSVGSPWGDPFADPTGPGTGTSGSSANQSQYPIRPWEIDLGSVPSSSTSQTTTTNSGPPNVLAPPSDATLHPGLPRPPHHAPTAAQYFHPPVPSIGPTYIDQRLPSFQSQFQATADAATAAAFHVPATHYSALGKSVNTSKTKQQKLYVKLFEIF